MSKPYDAILRYSRDVIEHVLRGVGKMKESVTYQAIIAEGKAIGLAEGRTEASLSIILKMGTKKFGPPDAATLAALRQIHDIGQLERISLRILSADSWPEMLQDTPE